MEYGLALVVLIVLVAVVATGPLRGKGPERTLDSGQAELEAAKQVKYREIRDAELDHRMGKLSREDWGRVDRELRAEAAEILGRLDRLGGDRG